MPKTRKIGTSETSGDWVCAWASWIHALGDWMICIICIIRLPESIPCSYLNVDLPSPGTRSLTTASAAPGSPPPQDSRIGVRRRSDWPTCGPGPLPEKPQ